VILYHANDHDMMMTPSTLRCGLYATAYFWATELSTSQIFRNMSIQTRYALLIAMASGFFYEIFSVISDTMCRALTVCQSQRARVLEALDNLFWYTSDNSTRGAGWMIVTCQNSVGSKIHKKIATVDTPVGFMVEEWLAETLGCPQELIHVTWHENILIECCVGIIKVRIVYHDDTVSEKRKVDFEEAEQVVMPEYCEEDDETSGDENSADELGTNSGSACRTGDEPAGSDEPPPLEDIEDEKEANVLARRQALLVQIFSSKSSCNDGCCVDGKPQPIEKDEDSSYEE
jgi:hypothetical protein